MPAKTSSAQNLDADVIVVGGGHSGCTMAALLASHNISVICVDQDDPAHTLGEHFDGRTMAISYGSQKVIDAAGAWDELAPQACPIEDIKIMDSGSPTLLEFLVKDVEGEAFGWIVENRLLRKSLYKCLDGLKKVQHIAPARVIDFSVEDDFASVSLKDGRVLKAQLIIGADGRGSFTREWMGIGTRGWSYDQKALVCVIEHENPHNNIAVEDFRAEGPFAVLPMMDDAQGRHRSSIVWSQHGHQKNSALTWDEESFNAAINELLPSSYGRAKLLGKRFSYPLTLIHAHRYTGPRMALVADAAHGIHPIAGQGLNLGLRDIAALAELLIEAKGKKEDLGSKSILTTYERRRTFDNMAMAAATDALNKLFSNDMKSVRILRKIGLRTVQKIAPARKFFMKQAMGASGLLPTLVKTGKFPEKT